MKIIRIFGCMAAVFALIAISGPAMAQQERDIIELVKTQIAGQRQALVAENMMLTASESEVFWPLYREYQGERNTMSDRRINLLRKFRDNFDGMDDAQSSETLDNWMKLEDDIQKLRKKYLKKFEKAIGGRTSLRYFQLENKLDAIIAYDLAQVVPLAQ